MAITLERDDAEMVLAILKRYLGALKEEIGKTENYDWRQDMKRDEERIKALIARLETETGAVRTEAA